MTLDECHQQLTAIRRRQGTRCPLIRVDCGGKVFRGRLARTDSDPESRREEGSKSPYLVLADALASRGPQTELRIDEIAPGSISELAKDEA